MSMSYANKMIAHHQLVRYLRDGEIPEQILAHAAETSYLYLATIYKCIPVITISQAQKPEQAGPFCNITKKKKG